MNNAGKPLTAENYWLCGLHFEATSFKVNRTSITAKFIEDNGFIHRWSRDWWIERSNWEAKAEAQSLRKNKLPKLDPASELCLVELKSHSAITINTTMLFLCVNWQNMNFKFFQKIFHKGVDHEGNFQNLSKIFLPPN